MPAIVIDQAWDRANPAELRAYGAAAVCRYLGEDTTGKNLTRAEADAYRAAGIDIVSNYEYSPGAALKGHAEGVRVAQLADRQHRDCGGPPDRPIYFSVDVDVSSGQLAAVGEFFRGVASVIGIARTGAYGEYDVIRYLFDNGLITYGWQTYAWSHGQWDERAQLRQVHNGISIAGHDVDRDESHAADYGQWTGGNGMSVGEEVSGFPVDVGVDGGIPLGVRVAWAHLNAYWAYQTVKGVPGKLDELTAAVKAGAPVQLTLTPDQLNTLVSVLFGQLAPLIPSAEKIAAAVVAGEASALAKGV